MTALGPRSPCPAPVAITALPPPPPAEAKPGGVATHESRQSRGRPRSLRRCARGLRRTEPPCHEFRNLQHGVPTTGGSCRSRSTDARRAQAWSSLDITQLQSAGSRPTIATDYEDWLSFCEARFDAPEDQWDMLYRKYQRIGVTAVGSEFHLGADGLVLEIIRFRSEGGEGCDDPAVLAHEWPLTLAMLRDIQPRAIVANGRPALDALCASAPELAAWTAAGGSMRWKGRGPRHRGGARGPCGGDTYSPPVRRGRRLERLDHPCRGGNAGGTGGAMMQRQGDLATEISRDFTAATFDMSRRGVQSPPAGTTSRKASSRVRLRPLARGSGDPKRSDARRCDGRAIRSRESASSQPPSIHWNGQNRLAGW